VSIGTEAQVDEVEDRRRAGNLSKSVGIAHGRFRQVGRFDGHGMELSGQEWGMFQQALAQVPAS